jgi:phosphoribosylformylglycinamidine synthase
LVSVATAQSEAFQQALGAVPAQLLGRVTAEPSLQIHQSGQSLLQQPIDALQQAFEQAIPRRMASGIPPTA